jgi:hypothetical protein
MKCHIRARFGYASVANDKETIYHSVFLFFVPPCSMPFSPGHRRNTPPRLTRWGVLAWLCLCLLLSPVGSLHHALTHLGEPPAASQDDAHPHEKLGHCDLCQLWDLLDATLPSAFEWVVGDAPHAHPARPLPAGAIAIGSTWFQSRAPPVQG